MYNIPYLFIDYHYFFFYICKRAYNMLHLHTPAFMLMLETACVTTFTGKEIRAYIQAIEMRDSPSLCHFALLQTACVTSFTSAFLW